MLDLIKLYVTLWENIPQALDLSGRSDLLSSLNVLMPYVLLSKPGIS